jgi:hypothetical protein
MMSNKLHALVEKYSKDIKKINNYMEDDYHIVGSQALQYPFELIYNISPDSIIPIFGYEYFLTCSNGKHFMNIKCYQDKIKEFYPTINDLGNNVPTYKLNIDKEIDYKFMPYRSIHYTNGLIIPKREYYYVCKPDFEDKYLKLTNTKKLLSVDDNTKVIVRVDYLGYAFINRVYVQFSNPKLISEQYGFTKPFVFEEFNPSYIIIYYDRQKANTFMPLKCVCGFSPLSENYEKALRYIEKFL